MKKTFKQGDVVTAAESCLNLTEGGTYTASRVNGTVMVEVEFNNRGVSQWYWATRFKQPNAGRKPCKPARTKRSIPDRDVVLSFEEI